MALRLPVIILLTIITNCALASDSGIHSMLIGDKVLELAQTRPLTSKSDGEFTDCAISPNGNYVACIKTTDDSFAVNIIRSKDGSARSFTPPIDALTKFDDAKMTAAKWTLRGGPVWSPDSKLLAISCWYCRPMPVPKGGFENIDFPEIETRLLILQPDCRLKASYRIQADKWHGLAWCSSIMFSPDSTRLAISAHGMSNGSESDIKRDDNWLEIMDVSDGRSSVIYTNDADCPPLILSWDKDGKTLLSDNQSSLVSIRTSDGGVSTLYDYSSGDPDNVYFSCDGKYLVDRAVGVVEWAGVAVKNVETGKDSPVAKSENARFECWFPNGNLLLYAIPQTIKDDAGKRTRELHTLWLSSVAGGNQSMCVALDADIDSVSSSYDYTKIAYLLDHRVHLAELEWRNATPQEKLDAGLKLTEEEEKQALIEQARQIGTALEQSMMARKSELPGSLDDIRDYAQEKTFMRPGTNQMIFKFIVPEDPWKTDAKGKRYIPGDTVIGEFDAGYTWKVVVYIGGRAQVLPK